MTFLSKAFLHLASLSSFDWFKNLMPFFIMSLNGWELSGRQMIRDKIYLSWWLDCSFLVPWMIKNDRYAARNSQGLKNLWPSKLYHIILYLHDLVLISMPYLLGTQLKNKALKVSITRKRITFSMSDDFMSCTIQSRIQFCLFYLLFLFF